MRLFTKSYIIIPCIFSSNYDPIIINIPKNIHDLNPKITMPLLVCINFVLKPQRKIKSEAK